MAFPLQIAFLSTKSAFGTLLGQIYSLPLQHARESVYDAFRRLLVSWPPQA
jgi:hypothetical protein